MTIEHFSKQNGHLKKFANEIEAEWRIPGQEQISLLLTIPRVNPDFSGQSGQKKWYWKPYNIFENNPS
jgi:hypothetical protein